MKIHKRLNRNVRRTDLHPCTSRPVKHPCRHDNRSARLSFDDDDVSAGALLTVIAPHRTAVECMPPVVNLYFLPDMGRITLRLPIAAPRGRFCRGPFHWARGCRRSSACTPTGAVADKSAVAEQSEVVAGHRLPSCAKAGSKPLANDHATPAGMRRRAR